MAEQTNKSPRFFIRRILKIEGKTAIINFLTNKKY